MIVVVTVIVIVIVIAFEFIIIFVLFVLFLFHRGKDLIRALRSRHREMEAKRRKDARKVEDLQTSIGAPMKRAIEGLDDNDNKEAPLFPSNEIESVLDTYTTISWKTVLTTIDAVVSQTGGYCTYNTDEAKVKYFH